MQNICNSCIFPPPPSKKKIHISLLEKKNFEKILKKKFKRGYLLLTKYASFPPIYHKTLFFSSIIVKYFENISLDNLLRI